MIEKTRSLADVVLFFGAGKTNFVKDSLCAFRAMIGVDLDLFNKDCARLCVVYFTLFEKYVIRFYSIDHGFTSPKVSSF
ncbi:aspartate--tRNA ligase, partial [Francisella tularensis subsp. holarctica]|nr:aspartate--tRNA ligase [Francisella tularensis subsp. holarctica]